MAHAIPQDNEPLLGPRGDSTISLDQMVPMQRAVSFLPGFVGDVSPTSPPTSPTEPLESAHEYSPGVGI